MGRLCSLVLVLLLLHCATVPCKQALHLDATGRLSVLRSLEFLQRQALANEGIV